MERGSGKFASGPPSRRSQHVAFLDSRPSSPTSMKNWVRRRCRRCSPATTRTPAGRGEPQRGGGRRRAQRAEGCAHLQIFFARAQRGDAAAAVEESVRASLKIRRRRSVYNREQMSATDVKTVGAGSSLPVSYKTETRAGTSPAPTFIAKGRFQLQSAKPEAWR